MTELTRWGRSTIDLFHTLGELQVWGISLIGLQYLQRLIRLSRSWRLISDVLEWLSALKCDLICTYRGSDEPPIVQWQGVSSFSVQ